MAERRMRVMPLIEVPPDGATVFRTPKPGEPVFTGDGPDSLLCGGCGHVLAQGLYGEQLQDLFIRCDQCDAMNDVNP
jgi:hypothetical protein